MASPGTGTSVTGARPGAAGPRCGAGGVHQRRPSSPPEPGFAGGAPAWRSCGSLGLLPSRVGLCRAEECAVKCPRSCPAHAERKQRPERAEPRVRGGLGWALWATGPWKADCGNWRHQQQQEGSAHAETPTRPPCTAALPFLPFPFRWERSTAEPLPGLGAGGSGSTRGLAAAITEKEEMKAEFGGWRRHHCAHSPRSDQGFTETESRHRAGSLAGPLHLPLSLLRPRCQPLPGTRSPSGHNGHGRPRGQHGAHGCPHELSHSALWLHQSLSRGPGAVTGQSPAPSTSPSFLSLHGGAEPWPPSTQQHLRKYFIVEGSAGALYSERTRRGGPRSPAGGAAGAEGAAALPGLGPAVEADDGPVVPHQIPQLVQVGVDVLLHPLLHGVREVDPLQLGTQVPNKALPVLMEPGEGRAGVSGAEPGTPPSPCRPLPAPSATYFSTLLPKLSMFRGFPNWRFRW